MGHSQLVDMPVTHQSTSFTEDFKVHKWTGQVLLKLGDHVGKLDAKSYPEMEDVLGDKGECLTMPAHQLLQPVLRMGTRQLAHPEHSGRRVGTEKAQPIWPLSQELDGTTNVPHFFLWACCSQTSDVDDIGGSVAIPTKQNSKDAQREARTKSSPVRGRAWGKGRKKGQRHGTPPSWLLTDFSSWFKSHTCILRNYPVSPFSPLLWLMCEELWCL